MRKPFWVFHPRKNPRMEDCIRRYVIFLGLSYMFYAISAKKCSNSSSLVGLKSDFRMIQHQLRGVFSVVDDCSFSVEKFDMIKGSDVHWWGAHGEDFENLTNGFTVSEEKLNRTYKNESLVVGLNNVSWDQIRVLGVWDSNTASDFGHVVLWPLNDESQRNVTAPTLSSHAPVPVPVKEPMMFDNCVELAPNYRLRWTLNKSEGAVEIGLEAVISEKQYMAFGWARPGSTNHFMLRSDVTVAGFTSESIPFADDYYVSEYKECLMNKDEPPLGVCPDFLYDQYEGNNNSLSNTEVLYGQRLDGVALIRYKRGLNSSDLKHDVQLNESESMDVIWAMGSIKPPDSLQPLYLPQNHGESPNASFGYTAIRLADRVDRCLGPLEAETMDDRPVTVADGTTPLVVGVDSAVHYPNPPNPDKVLYINKKEAPVLRVERGVPVTFSIQAGHDVAFCITSDPIGGAALRNESQDLYIGGEDAHGVPAKPLELTWTPDRKTPDQLYYQSYYAKKMGWKVEVVDGGLTDMYNNSVFLDDQQVTLFWTLSHSSISFAVRGEHKSNYLAIAFGSQMVNSYAYVGWVDSLGKGHVDTYWIDGRDASNIHPTQEELSDVRLTFEKGIITFEFNRTLDPKCSKRVECKNIIDPSLPLKVVWASGALWSDGNLNARNMHSKKSNKAVIVHLLVGAAEADQVLQPVLAVHGFMMFLAWGVLLPGGVLAARYLKYLKGDGWFQVHVYLQYSGILVMLLGLLFAAAELRGFHIESLHVKFGVAAIVFACGQVANACLRPRKPALGEQPTPKRLIWEYIHVITGRSTIIIGVIALISGLSELGKRYGKEHIRGLNWALISWIIAGAVAVAYMEYRERKNRRDAENASKGNWVMGNNDDDDSADLLPHSNLSSSDRAGRSSRNSQVMEVQLEPIH